MTDVLTESFIEWIDSKKSRGTRVKYAYNMRFFMRWAAGQGRSVAHPGEVTLQVLTAYWRHLEARHGELLADGRILMASKTAQSKMAAVLSFLDHCKALGLITSHPAPGFMKGRYVEGGRRQAITLREVRGLIDWAKDEIIGAENDYERGRAKARHVAFVILASTGMRVGELVNLRLRDYCPRSGVVRILAKGNKVHRILLQPSTCKVIDSFLRAYPARADTRQLVLIPGTDRSKTHATTVNAWLADACEGTGIPRVTSHQLRSTLATELHMVGAPLVDIQRLLGHASPEMTAKYVHLVDERKQAASLRIDVLSPG